MPLPTDDAGRRYLDLPYRIELARDGADDERPWRAVVEELPGCEVRGTTPPDAVSRIQAAMAEWVASAQAAGREVPQPHDARAYSGKLLLRMPKSLHADVAHAAERDQISINNYINSLLAAGVQWRRPPGEVPEGTAFATLDEDLTDEAPGPDALRRMLRVAVAANIATTVFLAALAVVLLLAA
jgi:antitoxin HicB